MRGQQYIKKKVFIFGVQQAVVIILTIITETG